MNTHIENDQIAVISRILIEEFEKTPYRKAAERILAAGLTSEHLLAYGNTATGRMIPDPQKVNTFNAMRDLELGIKVRD